MKTVATFPEFEKLSHSHLPFIRSVAAAYPQYSEFTFTNLFAWDTSDRTEVSSFPGGVIARLRNRDTGNDFYTLIGSDSMDSLVGQLMDMSHAKNLEGLRRVPQVVVDNLHHPDNFVIEEDRDNFDYVLSATYHAELKGAKNATRRRLIRRFLRENDQVTVDELDLTTAKVRDDILACMSHWMRTRGKDPQKSEAERVALGRVLDSCRPLNVHALGVYVGGAMRAFVVFEYLTSDVGVVHFEKCDLDYKGLAQYVHHCLAKLFASNRMGFINYEQDLGIEGLRQAKSRLHPDGFLKKYTIKA